jgi:hypothetical protein
VLDDTAEYVVMSAFGPKADWLLNLNAGGGVAVTVGRRHFRPGMRVLPDDDAAAILADYERRNRILAPLIRRVLSALAGWHYAGTDDERLRLVRRLPLIALGPSNADSSAPARPVTADEGRHEHP